MNDHLKRFVLLTLCLTSSACSHQSPSQQGPAVRVHVSQATLQIVPQEVSAVGNIEQGLAPIISSPIRGEVMEIVARPNQPVVANQILATIQADGARAKDRPPLRVRAGHNGTITRILVTPGTPVGVGTPLFGFFSHEVRKARVPFPLSLASRLHIGEAVWLHSPLAPRTPATGHIVRIDTHPRLKALYAIIALPARRGWTTGSPVRADVVISHQDAVVVPLTSVALRSQGTVVFVIHKNHVEMRPVQIGTRLARTVVISSGVTKGTPIVTRVNPLLVNGSRIRVARTRTRLLSANHASLKRSP